MPALILSAEIATRAAEIVDALGSHFGGQFAVWRGDGQNLQHVTGQPYDIELQREELLGSLADSTTAYSIRSLSENEVSLALAWSTSAEDWFVASRLQCTDPSWLRLLTDSWFREQMKDAELKEWNAQSQRLSLQADRASDELAFARQIAVALASCDASQNLESLAEVVLPDLHQAVQAETMALVQSNGECDSSNLDLLHRVGSAALTDRQVLKCVERFAPNCRFEPLIVNNVAAGTVGDQHSISNAIVACVHKGDDIAGWLVAVNPVRSDENRAMDYPSAVEFNAFESNLMETAASFLSSQARNASLISELEELVTTVVRVLVATIEAKDPYTRGHSERVAAYARAIGVEMGYSQEEASRVYFAGLLHDIGKIAIPDAILNKPDQLDMEEFEQIKSHPGMGWEIVKDIDNLSYVKAGILHHHERVDGKGYPDGLAGSDIPMLGRILAVADAFDAMTSDRSYRTGLTVDQVVEIMRHGAGTQWDAAIVDAMCQVLPEICAIGELK